MNWKTTIGLEVHAQLKTNTKIFSSDATEFGSQPNTQIHLVSMGLPGALPTINEEVVKQGVKIGLALNCKIHKESVFSRKHYFYPDLPKAYQITQFDKPVCGEGFISFDVDGVVKKVRIERAHLEEDAGKSIHKGSETLVDFNRSGIALLEIVSGPDMESPKEAAQYARTIRQILRYLDACDGNLEEGSMRCDCNVSVRPEGQEKLGTRAEIKNINSFRFIEKAIEYEVQRQITLLEAGETISQETRLYDSQKNKTFSMRSKEEAMDYRYFPEPDLLPLILSDKYIQDIKDNLPETPYQKIERYKEDYSLSHYDAAVLTEDKESAIYFEKSLEHCSSAKDVANWMMSELFKFMNDKKADWNDLPVRPEDFGGLVGLVVQGDISGKMGKKLFQKMWETQKSPKDLVKEMGLKQISDPEEIRSIIQKILLNYPEQLAAYKAGKQKLFGFFVGEIMKETKGQAKPELLQSVLREELKS